MSDPRCLIVDDSSAFRDAASAMLERGGIVVVGTACDAEEAVRRADELHPDIALVDVDLGADSGFDVAEQLRRHRGDPHLHPRRAGLRRPDRRQPGPGIPAEVRAVAGRDQGVARELAASSGFQIHHHRAHPPVVIAGLRQIQLGQDAAHVFLDRALGDPYPAPDTRVRQPLGHQGQHLAFRGR